MEADILQEIKCSICHKTKPISEFVKDKGYKSGIRPECKECKQKRMEKLLEKWKAERSTGNIPKEKKCSDCQQIKPVSDYTKDKYSKDGLSHYCKQCKTKRHKTLAEKWKKERAKGRNIVQKKECNTCHIILPSSQFTSNIRSKDGLSGICKQCDKKRTKDYKKRWKQERAQSKIKIKEKKCPSCNRKLSVSDFYPSENQKDGLSFYCKECELSHQREHKKKWAEERKKLQIKIPKEKICILCNRVLSADNFYKNQSLKDGLSSACIKCEIKRQRDYMVKWKEESFDNKKPITEKRCIKCKKKLPISMFYKNKRRKDGYTSACIDCEKKRGLDYVDQWKRQRNQKDSEQTFTLFPDFEKTCKICGRVLPTSQFYKKSRSKDGLSPNCIKCDLKIVKENRIKLKKKDIKREIPEEKFCTRCKRLLPSSEFHRLWSSGDGLAMHCKDCKSEIYKEYLKKPGVKEKLSNYKKEYRERPGVKEHERKRARRYSKRPYVKEKRKAYLKEYSSRPEVKKHRKKYLKEYYNRPEVKERVKLYYQESQNKKKLRDLS